MTQVSFLSSTQDKRTPKTKPKELKKACTKCGETYPATAEFWHRAKSGKYGLVSRCKDCIKQYRKDNAEKISEQKKQYRKDNADKIKQYYKNNTDKKTTQSKQYYKDNVDKLKKYSKQYLNSLLKYGSGTCVSLMLYEEIRQSKIDAGLVEVKCTYCDKWFMPKVSEAKNRLSSINGVLAGENRLYCSDNCKQSCDIYRAVTHRKGTKKVNSREVDPLVRKLCFEADNWTCQRCGNTTEQAPLHCHHIKSYKKNIVLANDLDNVITLCKKCHKAVHKQEDCNYYQLRCDYKAK